MFNRFAAGRKVYANGSYAPTRGTVNPKGYIKRELKKKARARAGLKPVPSRRAAGLALKHRLRTGR